MRKRLRGSHPRSARQGGTGPALAGAALLAHAVASACVGMAERNRWWRAEALCCGGSSLVAAALVWTFGRQSWLRWPVGISFALAVPMYLRLRMRTTRRKKRKKTP